MKEKISELLSRFDGRYDYPELFIDDATDEIAQLMCDQAAKIMVTLLTNFNAKRPHIQTLAALLHLGYDNEQIQKALQKIEDEMRGKEKV